MQHRLSRTEVQSYILLSYSIGYQHLLKYMLYMEVIQVQELEQELLVL